jgi:error-prone DNA polymerase
VVGWNDGPPTWAEMERVLNSRPLSEPAADGSDGPAWSRKRAGYAAPDLAPPRSTVPYAELHAHSAFSFLDGASTPEELVEEAARLGLRAIALTDHDGLYGVVRFAEAARELQIRRRVVAG